MITKPMYYVSPLAWLGFLVCGLPGLLILYFSLRKRVDVTYFINARVQRSRRIKVVIALTCFFGGIGLMFFGGTQNITWLIPVGLFTLFAGLIGSLIYANTLVVNGHKEGEFRIKGCCPEFLGDALVGVDDPYHDDDYEVVFDEFA